MFKYTIHIGIIYLLSFNATYAQKDSLNFEFNTNYKVKYQLNNQETNQQKFYSYLSKNDPALKLFKKGKTQNFVGQTLAYAGGFLIGWNIGDIMFNNKKDYTLGLAGLGVAALSFPITYGGLKKSKKGIALYNENDIAAIQPETKNTFLNDDELKWNSSCLIFRMPVYGPKINFLKNKLKDSSLSTKTKAQYQKQLDVTLADNKTYFEILSSGFNDEFNVKKVHIIPDSSFKSFIEGKSPGFLNKFGALDPSLQCQSDQNFYIITGKDIDQLLFVDHLFSKPNAPFPHRKNVFLPAFKKIWDRKNFIRKQIRYFNEKLLPLSKSSQ